SGPRRRALAVLRVLREQERAVLIDLELRAVILAFVKEREHRGFTHEDPHSILILGLLAAKDPRALLLDEWLLLRVVRNPLPVIVVFFASAPAPEARRRTVEAYHPAPPDSLDDRFARGPAIAFKVERRHADQRVLALARGRRFLRGLPFLRRALAWR